MPFFSVVIPVFNRAGLFRKTLITILAQDYRDFEVVVIDDGSTDDTASVVAEISQQHPNVKYQYQENAERGAARNRGIRIANGRYVVLFDSDDTMHPDHLNTLHAHLQRLGFPDFIATKFDFAQDGRHRPSDSMRLAEGYYDYRLLLAGNSLACHICLRKENAALHLFEEDRQYASMEDWMFLLQNLKNSTLYLIDKVTVSMNVHDDRSMLDNAGLVKKAGLALQWMLRHVQLTVPEQKQLEAQVYFFSAIHSYLDSRRAEANRFLQQATVVGGFRLAYGILFLKNLIGHKHIRTLRR